MEKFTLNNGASRITSAACRRNSAHMLPVTDWLSDLPENIAEDDLVEVQFKNTRKGYYRNDEHLPLKKGDMVAVDAAPGHDIGEVTLTGLLVKKQMKKYRIDLSRYEIHTIYRVATEQDLARAAEAHEKEQETMIKARALAKSLGLEMKVGDVEYQGDGAKAIFYYIADGRVDFRQLIKVYAETFRVRIEMKQIGARQEAGRIGGTGPCGRELCCSTWMTNFHSVGTGAARLQNISPNPQKLAGQCAKLKCCLNYEVDTYEEAAAKIPSRDIILHTLDADWYFFSSDPLMERVTYSSDPHIPANLQTITVEQANLIIEMNNSGQKPDSLGGKSTSAEVAEVGYLSGVGQDDLNRFDNRMGGKKKKRKDQKEKPQRQLESQHREKPQRQRTRMDQEVRRADKDDSNKNNPNKEEKGNE